MYISKEQAMDEYLFITLAKLKADRLRLEREQRTAANFAEPPLETLKPSQSHASKAPHNGWFSRAPQWREQS
jgi:hypothetical protein